MNPRTRRVFVPAGCVAGMVLLGLWQQGRSGPDDWAPPVAQWVFDQPAAGATVPNAVAGGPAVKLVGTPRLVGGPTPGLEFSGETDAAFVNAGALAKAKALSKEAISIAAWVRVDRPEPPGGLGGIVGHLQNHFDADRGFLVGYDADAFVFGLAAESAASKAGAMTFLRSRTRFQPGRWYHVAGTYDGRAMKLLVNGKAEAESVEQYGPVRYPGERVPLAIGRYRNGTDPADGYNNNEDDVPFVGAIREVALFDRALTEAEAAAAVARHRDLIDAAPAEAPPHFVVPPYLQFATGDSVTVMWETSRPGASVVEFGTGTVLDRKAESKTAATQHEVRLTGLKPETKYFYRASTPLEGGGTLTGDLRTLQTAVLPTSAFTFAAVGDTQANPRMTGRVARQIWARRPNFVIHCGDVVDYGPDKAQWVNELLRPCGPLLGRVPVYPCIGNHEKDHANYYRTFAVPAPEYYYRYSYGNADFFSIDSNRPLKPGSEQYEWLDRELGKSTAAWKFVYHHHPARSSDDNDYGNTWKGEASKYGDVNAQHLIALYEKHRVDINFNGHIHVYERSWPVREGKVDRARGVVYVTTGGGGATLENVAPTPAWFKAQCRSDYHYCLLTVHGGRLEFKTFDHRGQMFDSFELSK